MLDGKQATSWYGYIDHLQDMTPKAEILRDTRFVDNGHIITTAGVSAGMDGALHLVSKLKGIEVAQNTARYMEYQNWNPEAGLVVENKFLSHVESAGVDAALEMAGGTTSPQALRELFFEGEILNLGQQLLMQNRLQEAIEVFELAITAYPACRTARMGLSDALSRLDTTADGAPGVVRIHGN